MFKKATGKGISVPAAIGIGVLICIAISLAGAMIAGYLLTTESIAVSDIGWCVILISAAASFVGAMLAASAAKANRLPVCLGVGTGYVAALLGSTALFFGGQYQGVATMVITVLLACGAAGFLGWKGRKQAFRKKKIPVYR